jgi:hypothetical protein
MGEWEAAQEKHKGYRMTTIAFRAGVLATDSGVQANGTRHGTVQKTFKAPDGSLIAYAGNAHLHGAIEHWIDHGLKVDAVPDTEDKGTILWIKPDATIWVIDGGGLPFKIDAPFYADGSGGDIALGAMGAGATAVQAVEIALHLDSGSSGPVQYVELGNIIPFQKKS